MPSTHVISDLARLTYLGKEKLVSLFKKKSLDPIDILRSELEAMVSRIADEHKSSEEALEKLTCEASSLLEELRVREEAELKRWRENASDWLRNAGVDPKCVEEFLREPTLAKLDELRSRYPYSKK